MLAFGNPKLDPQAPNSEAPPVFQPHAPGQRKPLHSAPSLCWGPDQRENPKSGLARGGASRQAIKVPSSGRVELPAPGSEVVRDGHRGRCGAATPHSTGPRGSTRTRNRQNPGLRGSHCCFASSATRLLLGTSLCCSKPVSLLKNGGYDTDRACPLGLVSESVSCERLL